MFTRWRFRSALRQVLREKLAKGKISHDFMWSVDDDKIFDHAYAKLDVPWWRNIVSWIRENWSTILSILVLFLENEPND
jgi:hypothetical protein